MMQERFINCPACRNGGQASYRMIVAGWKQKLEDAPSMPVFATGAAPRFCKRHRGEFTPVQMWGRWVGLPG